MKPVFILLFLASFVVPFSVRAQTLHGNAGEQQAVREAKQRLQAAIQKGDTKGVEREAGNLKAYGAEGDGKAMITAAIQKNQSDLGVLKQAHQELSTARDAASQKSIKNCNILLTNIEKKFTGQAFSSVVSAYTGGNLLTQLYDSIQDVRGHMDDAGTLKGNAAAIKALDGFVKQCNELLGSLKPARDELIGQRDTLSQLSDAFDKGASQASSPTSTTKSHKSPKKSTGGDKSGDQSNDDGEKDTTVSNKPTKSNTTKDSGDSGKKSSGNSGTTDIEKGTATDKNGTTKVTQTVDGDGNVIKTTYSNYDKNGKFIGKTVYGPDGEGHEETEKPNTDTGRDTGRDTAKTSAQDAAKTAAQDAAKQGGRPPVGGGGGGCPPPVPVGGGGGGCGGPCGR
jgi:hypothetical protein